jgi:1,4-alpha-glucan branching enzyme
MSNLGANLTTEGCNFKVWAPNAQEVFVVGDFNSWDKTKDKLDKNDSDGTWSGFVGEAKAEDKYKYYIIGPTWNSQLLWKPDPYARQMEHSAGSSIIKDEKVFFWEDSEFKPAWVKEDCNSCFEEAVIYELHVGTFSGKNDGFEKNGNFKKLISKLDYLEKLGINTIEILPIHENMFDFYLGYAPIALMPIESSYGTGITDGKAYDELKEFINEAHKKNISVIVDVVFNHLLTIDADECDDKWLLNYDGDTFYDKGGIYFSGNITKWGPAINWEKDEIKKYVEDTCRFYLEELHIDGLRWDVTAEIKNKPNGWNAMREIIWNLKESTKNKIFIAEHLPYVFVKRKVYQFSIEKYTIILKKINGFLAIPQFL